MIKSWSGPILFFNKETRDHRIVTGHGLLFPLKVPVLVSVPGDHGIVDVGVAHRFGEYAGSSGVRADMTINMYQIPGPMQGKRLYPAVDLDGLTISIDPAPGAPDVALISGGVLRAITLVEFPAWDGLLPVTREELGS